MRTFCIVFIDIKMSEKRFSSAEIEKLIALVQQNPALFNPKFDLYKDSKYRDAIWKDIAEKLNRNENDCRKRWKYIRDSYNRIRRKQLTSFNPSKSPSNSNWGKFGNLHFLDVIKKNKELSPNIDSDSATGIASITSPQSSWEIKSEDEIYIIGTPQSPSLSSPSKPPKKKLRKIKRRKEHDNLNEFLKLKTDKQLPVQDSNDSEIDDDVTSFANHVKSVLRKLNSRMKIQAKNEIFNLLIHYETAQLDLQNQVPLSDVSTTNSKTSEILSL